MLERGAKTILIRPAPVPGYGGSRSFGFEEFDPFWQAVVDADILVSMHASDSGYARYQTDWTGPQEMLPFRPDAFRMMTHGKRPDRGHDVGAGLPRRVHPLPGPAGGLHRERRRLGRRRSCDHLEDVYRKMPQAFDEDPIEAFKRNICVSPFHEDDIGGLIDADRRRPRPVRVRLPPPRGPGRALQLRRPPARRRCPTRTSPGSWAATWPRSCGSRPRSASDTIERRGRPAAQRRGSTCNQKDDQQW